MLVPYLKHLHVDETPMDKENFNISLVLDVGVVGMNGADQFYCSVMSPSALVKELEERTIMSGRGLLIIDEFDLDIITLKINEVINSFSGEEWEDVVMCINKHFPWEYDGFIPDMD